MSELLQDWRETKARAREWALPDFRIAHVRTAEDGVPDTIGASISAALDARLGWARFQSAVAVGPVWRGPDEDAKARAGRLLQAEWRDTEDEAVSWRFAGGRLFRLEAREGAGAGAGWRPALVRRVTLAGHGRVNPIWDVAFAAPADDPPGFAPVFARFIGFETP